MSDMYDCSTPQSERARFYTRKQKASESIEEYLVELKRLATTCEFGGFWNEAIRDRFIMGIRNVVTRDILLKTRNLTLEHAVDIAIANEAVVEENLRFKKETSATEAGSTTSPQSADSPAQPPTSHHISKPGTSQDVFIVYEELSNENTQANIATSNPQPLSYPAMANTGQPNQGPINGHTNDNSIIPYRDVSYTTPVKTENGNKIFHCHSDISPAQDPTSYHNTSMPGTSQDLCNISQDSLKKNIQAYLTTTSNPRPISFTTLGTPSTSYEDGQNHEPSLVPFKSSDGKKIFECSVCSEKFPHGSILLRHYNKHTPVKKFRCKFCNNPLSSQGSKYNHESRCKQNPNSIRKEESIE